MNATIDPEMRVIGRMIEVVTAAKAEGLDSAAWRRINDYGYSLCSQAEREAREREQAEPRRMTPAERPAARKRQDRSAEWHVLGPRRKPRVVPA